MYLSSHTGLPLHHSVPLCTFRNSSSAFLANLLRGLTLSSLLNTSVPSQATKRLVPSMTHQKLWEPDCILATLYSPFLSSSYGTTVTRCNIPPWNFTEIPILTILLTCSSKISYLVSCSLTDYPSTHIQACAGMLKSDCTFREHTVTQWKDFICLHQGKIRYP